MDEQSRFEPGANVAADIVEGEAILIRLEDGVYFSMNPVGTRVWQLIEARVDLGAMIAALSAACSVEKHVVARDLSAFLDRLIELRLVQPSADAATGEIPALATGSYGPPVVEVYEDMADLLALDPPAPGRDLKSLDPK